MDVSEARGRIRVVLTGLSNQTDIPQVLAGILIDLNDVQLENILAMLGNANNNAKRKLYINTLLNTIR